MLSLNISNVIRRIFLLVTALVATGNSLAIDIGSPAPLLKISEWVDGKPLEISTSGTRVSLVVFWEVGCNSCTSSIPHLVSLQQRYTNRLNIAAITREPADMVKQFLAAQPVNFSVGLDNRIESFHDYMTSSGETAFPHAFLISTNGILLWHRHPEAGLDKALTEILSGKFDIEAEKKSNEAAKLQSEYLRLATQSPTNSETLALGRKIVNDGKANPWLLNNFAWAILTTHGIESRDYALAEKAVKAACDAVPGNAAFADTYARALFDSGKASKAIEMERRAITLSRDPKEAADYTAALTNYEAAAKLSQ